MSDQKPAPETPEERKRSESSYKDFLKKAEQEVEFDPKAADSMPEEDEDDG